MKDSSHASMSVFAVLMALQAGNLLATERHPAGQARAHEAPKAAAGTHRHAVDPALREGMARIHAALDELRHYELGHMPQALAFEQIDEIVAAIDFLFTHCTLDPEADAALHGMLVPLLDAVQAFRKRPDDVAGIAAMRQAVADYPRLFEDRPPPAPSANDRSSTH